MFYLTLATSILNWINQYVYKTIPGVVDWLVLEEPAFKISVLDNPIKALEAELKSGRTDALEHLLELPELRDNTEVCVNFVKWFAEYPQTRRDLSPFEPIILRFLRKNPLILDKLIENDSNFRRLQNLPIIQRKLIKEATLEVARSTYSDLKPSHDMAFPDNMNSEYATQYAMGILSNLKFSPGAPNPILNKIYSYLPGVNSETFVREAQMLVAERNALLAPKVEEASPTWLIERKANYEDEKDLKRKPESQGGFTKRLKLSTDVDVTVAEQEEKDHKRKPESQGGSSKRLRR